MTFHNVTCPAQLQT